MIFFTTPPLYPYFYGYPPFVKVVTVAYLYFKFLTMARKKGFIKTSRNFKPGMTHKQGYTMMQNGILTRWRLL